MLLLERRLDNVVYRLGLATTRRQARQFVNHGHILVDGKRVDIPSYRVTPGQVISVREKSLKVPAILEAVEATLGRPSFVSFDAEKLEGSLTRLPERDEINPETTKHLSLNSTTKCFKIRIYIVRSLQQWAFCFVLKTIEHFLTVKEDKKIPCKLKLQGTFVNGNG